MFIPLASTNGLVSWLIHNIVPLGLVILGLVIIFGARNGQFSKVMSQVLIALVGVVMIAGAGLFYAFGDNIAKITLGG